MTARRPSVRVFPRFLLGVLLGTAGALPLRPLVEAADRKILIVKSSALSPFEKASRGFKKCAAEKGLNASFEELALPADAVPGETALRAAVAGKPDLILTIGTQASQLVRRKFGSVPSIFCMVMDPAGNGLDRAGVSVDPSPEDYAGYIRQYFPQFKRIGILHDPSKSKAIVDRYRSASVSPSSFAFEAATDIKQIDGAIRALKTKADCMLMIVDGNIYTPQTSPQILLQTIQIGLPFFALSSPYVKGGALAALYADWEDNGCQAADLADRALQGEKIAALPLVPPRKFSSAINLVVAGRINVEVPSAARAAAEELIK